MSFNPNSPCVLGLEWFPDREAEVVLGRHYLALWGVPPGQAAAQVLASQVTETITDVGVYLSDVLGSGNAGYDIEVYDVTDLPGQTLTDLQFWPGADAFNYQGWCFNSAFAPNGSSNNLYQSINNPTQVPNVWPNTGQVVDDDFIFNIFGQGYTTSFYANSISGSVTNQLITKVKVSAKLQSYATSSDLESITVTPFLRIGGTNYFGQSVTKTGRTPGGWLVESEWLCNPATRSGWRDVDIDRFDTSAVDCSFGWLVRPTGSSNILGAIHQGWMTVQHAGPDPRVALGNITAVQKGWNLIEVAELDGSPWAKLDNTSYVFVFRRRITDRNDASTVAMRYLSSGLSLFDGRPMAITQTGPVNNWQIVNAKFTPNAETLYELVYTNQVAAWASPMLLKTSTPSISTDSMPYALCDGDPGVPLTGTNWTLVNSAQTLDQEFTTPGTLPDPDYGVVSLLVALESSTTDADLEIRVLNTSLVQQGSTLVITADDLGELADDRTRWKLLERQLPGVAPTLSTATQYLLDVSSDATPGQGWKLQVLSTQEEGSLGGPPTGTSAATFGGTTDRLQVNTVAHDYLEACVSLATVPLPPADFAVSVQESATCVQFLRVSWTSTAMSDCGGFGGYEIQRSDDEGTSWNPIALISSEGVDHFDDYESIRNREAWYRIRVRRADGAISNWEDPVTATASMGCCGYIFTSNELPELTQWYDDLSDDGSRKVDYPQDTQVKRFYGRDYSVVFFGLERPGAQFQRTLMIAGQGTTDGTAETTTPGQRTFQRLHQLTRPADGGDVSYVCVHSRDDRWLASVLTPSTLERNKHGWYTADVQIIEVTNIPSTPDVAP